MFITFLFTLAKHQIQTKYASITELINRSVYLSLIIKRNKLLKNSTMCMNLANTMLSEYRHKNYILRNAI